MKAMDNRTDTAPSALYTFVGMSSIRASHLVSDFLVETSTEPHEDGTVRICEALVDGSACVWGEDASGSQIWFRENDTIARTAIEGWLNNPAMPKARALSKEANP